MTGVLYTFLSKRHARLEGLLGSLCTYTGIEWVAGDRSPLRLSDRGASAVLVSDSVLDGWESSAREELYQMVQRDCLKVIVVNQAGSPAGETGTMVFSAGDEDRQILGELAGTRIPVRVREMPQVDRDQKVRQSPKRRLIGMELPDGSVIEVLGLESAAGREILHLSCVDCEMVTKDPAHKRLPEILPLLICLRRHFGERCWHRVENHANLTIDDPWLCEPYGYLAYHELLKRMKSTPFHTTIAFVPWNYARNREDVVSLFRDHDKHYSISVHGNNHDRYEFRDYRSVPLEDQRDDIVEAGARMREFSRRTRLSYDRVMVFPQYICPEETIEVLKSCNYLSSANCTTIPLGGAMKDEVEHTIMPAVTEYYGFPLLKRYHPTIDKNIININMYLGKPLLFYAHHDYFKDTIGQFDEVAAYVNLRSGNAVTWSGLGAVTEKMYLVRRDEDSTHHIRMLSRKVKIAGAAPGCRRYRIDPSLLQPSGYDWVAVNDRVYTRRDEMEALFCETIEVAEGETLAIEIGIRETAPRRRTGVRRSGVRVAAIRYLCDFRDIVVPRARQLVGTWGRQRGGRNFAP